MSKHKNKNRTPKKTFLDAMQEIEPSLTEDNLFSEIYDNALEIEDVGYEDINAAYADVDSDMMTSDTVIFSKIGNKYLVLFDRDDYTSAEADVESIEFSIFDNESDAAKKFKEKIFEEKAENLPDYETAISNFEKAVKERTGEDNALGFCYHYPGIRHNSVCAGRPSYCIPYLEQLSGTLSTHAAPVFILVHRAQDLRGNQENHLRECLGIG